ncbi:hypothetical protein U1Q18_051448 [Sarracenia purpurea var. burkii]
MGGRSRISARQCCSCITFATPWALIMGLARNIVKTEWRASDASLSSSMEDAAKRYEAISFADAELQWDMGLQMEADADTNRSLQILLGEGVQAAGDKIALRHGQQLVGDQAEKFKIMLPDYCRHDEMRTALLSSTGAELDPTRLGLQAMNDLRDRVEFARDARLGIDSAALDYAPYVAAMRRQDDEAERVSKDTLHAVMGAIMLVEMAVAAMQRACPGAWWCEKYEDDEEIR